MKKVVLSSSNCISLCFQAAIGAIALDTAKEVGDENLIKLGEQVRMEIMVFIRKYNLRQTNDMFR